jgi:DNA-binding SARP family transcriptional activator/tetratricopeptide (TPR) repeat protein
VDFRVLGHIQIHHDGREIDAGHARQQCVLAVLLVEANRSVSTDQLCDRVWADGQPQRARPALYSYLSRIRRVLAADARVRLRYAAGAYTLDATGCSVDMHQFRALVAARRRTDDRELLSRLDEALALWRGEPFAGLDTPWLVGVRAQLLREQFGAQLERYDAALRLGRHAESLPALVALASDHPLDERLAGQVMLALYRSGRAAESLTSFDRIRRQLADELGTDPSPALSELHRRVLTADPELAWPTPSGVPSQLPRPVAGFAGRTRELAALSAALDQPGAVVALTGTAGVGKSALAVHWAHRVRERFPDGQLYLNLRGFEPGRPTMEPGEAVQALLGSLLPDGQRLPVGQQAQENLYRSLLADRRALVILDNAHDSAQVRPLLPGSFSGLTVVTSRDTLVGLIVSEAATPLTLETLEPAEGRELLARRLGPARVAAEPEAVDAVLSISARLPLALAVVAARAVVRPSLPLADMAEELRASTGRLDAFAGADPRTDVRAVFSWSYRALSPDAARLFRYLALHPGPDLDVTVAASQLGPGVAAWALLDELAAAQLVYERAPGRYAFHDLLRTYATELVAIEDSETEQRAVLGRILESCLHSAQRAKLLVDPQRSSVTVDAPSPGVVAVEHADRLAAVAWFAAEQPVLVAIIQRGAEAGFDRMVWQLTAALAHFFDRRGLWHDLLVMHRTALAAAERVADDLGKAHAYRGMARANIRLGDLSEAERHLAYAFQLFEKTGDRSQQARTALDESWLLELGGNAAAALARAENALELFRVTADRPGEAYARNAVGWTHGLLDDYRRELEFCRSALTLLRELGDLRGEADTWDSLGHAHHRLHDHVEAIRCYEQALAAYRELGDRYGEGSSLAKIGEVARDAGDVDAATEAWRSALAVLRQLRHPDAERIQLSLSGQSASE